MCQHRLNTSDSCPPGKFRVRVRTERVKDQVAVTETRQALSSSLHGACLTGRRDEKRWKSERTKERKGEPGRENGNMTDKKKKREEVAR